MLSPMKMNRSRGSTIDLNDSTDTVAKKVRPMYAGPPRGANEQGKVETNPVFGYLDADPNAAEVSDRRNATSATASAMPR